MWVSVCSEGVALIRASANPQNNPLLRNTLAKRYVTKYRQHTTIRINAGCGDRNYFIARHSACAKRYPRYGFAVRILVSRQNEVASSLTFFVFRSVVFFVLVALNELPTTWVSGYSEGMALIRASASLRKGQKRQKGAERGILIRVSPLVRFTLLWSPLLPFGPLPPKRHAF